MKKILLSLFFACFVAAGCSQQKTTESSQSANSNSQADPLLSDMRFVKETKLTWNGKKYSIQQWCSGQPKEVKFEYQDYPSSFCVGKNVLVLKTPDSLLIKIDEQNSTSVNEVPILDAAEVLKSGNVLISYWNDTCASLNDCGVGMPWIRNFVVDLNNDTSRQIKNFPKYASTWIWNSSETRAVFLPGTGGAGCDKGEIEGWDLKTDTLIQTKESGCFEKGGSDIDGNPIDSWDNLHWVTDSLAQATFIPVKGNPRTVSIQFK